MIEGSRETAPYRLTHAVERNMIREKADEKEGFKVQPMNDFGV
jgi:hypothetical protein